jgi:hypothetical protein
MSYKIFRDARQFDGKEEGNVRLRSAATNKEMTCWLTTISLKALKGEEIKQRR